MESESERERERERESSSGRLASGRVRINICCTCICTYWEYWCLFLKTIRLRTVFVEGSKGQAVVCCQT